MNESRLDNAFSKEKKRKYQRTKRITFAIIISTNHRQDENHEDHNNIGDNQKVDRRRGAPI